MSQRLSTYRLIAYASLSLPLAALTMPVYIFLPTYYGDDLGLSLQSVGLVLFLARLVDVLSDPVIGVLGDKTHNAFGRRKTWIAIGVIPTIIGTWALMNPPADIAGMAGLLYLFFTSIILYIGWTCLMLPLQAWGAELSTDYDERSRISAWREGLTVAGLLGTLGVLALLGFGDKDNAGKALNAIAWLIVITLPLTAFFCLKFVPDRKALKGPEMTFRQGIKVMAKNKPFRNLMLSFLINSTANGLPAILFIMFVRYVLQMPEYTSQLLFLYFLCGILAVPLWLKLSYSFGKHKVWCGAMVWACIFFALVPFVGAGDIWLYLAIVVLTGFSLGADLVLPASMQADVVDKDVLETGHQRTGLYFALWGMVTKLSLALAAGIAFPALDYLGFDEETGENLWALIGLYALIPVGFKLVAIAIMYRYPLSKDDVEKIREQIAEKWNTSNPESQTKEGVQ
mgnify:FL=1